MKPFACILGIAIVMTAEPAARAQCGREDGPALRSARIALKSGQLDGVLAWVGDENAPELRALFADVREVRRLGAKARELADRHFLETVARLHCRAVGEDFAGIEAPDPTLAPVLHEAEQALEGRGPDRVLALVQDAIEEGVRARWKDVLAARKNYTGEDAFAGHYYAAAYLEFVDYVAALYGVAIWNGEPAGDDMCGE